MLGLLGTLAKVFAPILKPIIHALQPVIKAVQAAVQQPAPQPTKKQTTQAAPTLTPEQQKEQAWLAAEKQRQQLVKEKDLGRDLSQNISTELQPVGKGLPLLGNPDAIQMIQIIQNTPWLIERALSLYSKPEQAMQFLLARNLDLSSEDIALLIKKYHPMNQEVFAFHNPSLQASNSCPQGWSSWENNQTAGLFPPLCMYTGNAGDPYSIVLPPTSAQDYELIIRQNPNRVRNLFLPPAQQLNDPNITNMSDEALAALVLSQVFVEEKWFKDFNWVHPYYNLGNDPFLFVDPNLAYLNDKRAVSASVSYLAFLGLEPAAQLVNTIQASREGDNITSGFGFGLGNQPYGQALAAAKWYLDYAQNNPQATHPDDLPTNVLTFLQQGTSPIPFIRRTAEGELLVELGDGGYSPLSEGFNNASSSTFWNVMRFVWAGAAQREGNPDPKGLANYATRENLVQAGNPFGLPSRDGEDGRPIYEVSAFSLMTTIYSGSVLLDFTSSSNTSERNKAITNVERIGANGVETARIVGEQGLREAPLNTPYDIVSSPHDLAIGVQTGTIIPGISYDFLPYSAEEARFLMQNLIQEANISNDAYYMLIPTEGHESEYAPLLREAYRFYYGEQSLSELDFQINELR